MNILVTGSAGMIGGYVVKGLIEKGHKVIGVDSVLPKTELRFSMQEIRSELKEFMENEARSCSMDFGCVTPIYVYRMWGGSVAIDEIATGLTELWKIGFMDL